MSISIRESKSEDWESIQKLNNDVFVSDSKNDSDLDLEWPFSTEGINYYKKVASGEKGYCLIAEKEGVPVGYVAAVKTVVGYRKSSYVEVDNIGVSPEYRSQGIGKKLMEAAENIAREQGIDKIFLSAYVGNKRGISFYKDLGFEEISLELQKDL